MLGMDLILHLRTSYDIVCTDIVESKHPVCKAMDFIKCDITKHQEAMDAVRLSKADIVVHTAAWTDVDACELDEDKAMRINAEGAKNIALGCNASNAVMFYISSDFVFDGTKDKPYTEDDKPAPLNIYGLSKLIGEEEIRRIIDRYFIVRTSWLFGKHGRNFVDIILDKAAQKKELRVVMDQFGSPTFTKDLSGALERLMQLSSKNKELGGVFHFSNSGNCSWFRYAEEILKIAGRPDARLLPITSAELDRPAKRPGMSVLDTEKYSKLCNVTPRRWQSALQDYLINEQEIKSDYFQTFRR